MKRLLVLGACLALAFGFSPASADTTAVGCNAGLEVHDNAQCIAGVLDVSDAAELELTIGTAIGPVGDQFLGRVAVVLKSTTGRLTRSCTYGPAGHCSVSIAGSWSDPIATCVGSASGIGSWAVSCAVHTNT